MQGIKMVDLRGQYLRIKSEIDNAIQEVLNSTAFIQGPQVSTFSSNLASFVGTPHVITCGNGTDALQIALMAIDLQPGDEVILPVHTYVATAEAIALLKLTPIFADVDQGTFNIDPKQIESKITKRTKAIAPVHLYGQCADMEPILDIAARHHLIVIEDAAQSLGSKYFFRDGSIRMSGNMGTAGITSFFPSKNLGCYGDGGAIFTGDKALAERMKMMANHGQRTKYHHDFVGINSRLDTVQAAILDVKLKYLTQYNDSRNHVAKLYDERLGEISDVVIPFRAGNATHVFHQYTLQAERRDQLREYLAGQGIPTLIYYPLPLHFQKAYEKPGLGPGSFPVAERLSKTIISLPIHTEMKMEEIEFICQAIRNFYQ